MKAVTLDNGSIEVQLIPECGGKIQSIRDKRHNKELLHQAKGNRYIKSLYLSDYSQGEASGFDEIFPSIEACYYPNGAWKGIAIPDHGEVWSIPWEYTSVGQALHMNVHGIRFPYSLEKSIQFIGESAFRISYKATNHSHFKFPFIWAPHALWVCESDTRIVLPPSVKRIMSTCSVPNRLGGFGTVHQWPNSLVEDTVVEIDRVYPKYKGKCEKYYALDKVNEGWCALRGEESGYTIGMAYPVEAVPYLGVWEGEQNGTYLTALEPCTGAFDALDTAMQWQKVSVIAPRSSYCWHLTIVCGVFRQELSFIDSNGVLQ